MAEMQDYEGPSEIYVGARLLAECRSLRISVTANNNKVYTMKRGLAGKSDGPRESEATIENAIPRKGYERDFAKLCIEGGYVRIVQRAGKTRRTFNGWIESAEDSFAVDSPASHTATFQGGPPDII